MSAFYKNQIIRLNEIAQRLEDSNEFRVIDLFRGGMGVCVKIRNEVSGNEYALKTVQSEFVEEHLSWTMFIEEMKTWLTLSACDGVAEAYCIVRINDLPYVCAKWMKGGDLRPLITSKDSNFFYQNVIRIIRTLEWVNDKHQIIHRDLKPENILLDEMGLVYVADWGLARPIVDNKKKNESSEIKPISYSRPELTQAGEFRGTILYASPEQILGLKDIDHRSDIYSLGCILYEWETGKPPFLGNTAEEIAYKHMTEPAQQIGSFFHKTVFGIEKIIQKCLEKNPEKRFQDYASLANAVIEAANQRGFQSTFYHPQQRYSMPQIGKGEFVERLQSKELFGISDKGKSYKLVEFEKIAPYIREAESLMEMYEWNKAKDIYERLFIPELTLSKPDDSYLQSIAINYADCLIQTNDAEKAILVLSHIAKAESKSAEYYVNLSLACLHLQNPIKAEETAKEGLTFYEDDPDILGNLLISQISQSNETEALKTAQRRLQVGRDVHTLEEIATLFGQIGSKYENTNLPEAVKYYKNALQLLLEAKELNPRFVTARLHIAETLFEIHQYSAAINELSDMFNLPTHEIIQKSGVVLFAKCLDRLSLHKECLDFCNKWLEKFPDNIELHRIKAETIVDGFCIGRIKDGTKIVERSSLEFFENVIDHKERKISDICYLSRLYEWMEKIDEAMNLLDEAEKINSDYWEIYFNRASFLLRLNDLDNALMNSLKSTQKAEWKPQNWRLLSKIYSLLNLIQESNQANQKAEIIEDTRSKLFEIES